MNPATSPSRDQVTGADPERSGVRPEHGDEAQLKRERRKRGRPNLERAHKTVTSTSEAATGAPRSGSI